MRRRSALGHGRRFGLAATRGFRPMVHPDAVHGMSEAYVSGMRIYPDIASSLPKKSGHNLKPAAAPQKSNDRTKK